jgi:uncharacterized membrane protein YsdA (DUF1294 family)
MLASRREVQHPTRTFVILLALGVLPGVAVAREHAAVVPLGLYALASLIGFLQYRSDKARAGSARRRIPERSLHVVEALGGWPGALLAQQVYRHKTRKVSFQIAFWLIVACHEAAWAAWLLRDRWSAR